MEDGEKSALMNALLELTQEVRLLRAERKEQPHVHVHIKPRVSMDTVVLSLAAALVALGGFWACVQPVSQ